MLMLHFLNSILNLFGHPVELINPTQSFLPKMLTKATCNLEAAASCNECLKRLGCTQMLLHHPQFLSGVVIVASSSLSFQALPWI